MPKTSLRRPATTSRGARLGPSSFVKNKPHRRRGAPESRGNVRVERASGGFTLGMDLSTLPVPETRLEADHWWAYQRDGAISIVFDQVPTAGTLKFRFEARMSYEAFVGLIGTIENEAFKSAFQKYLDSSKVPAPSTPKPSPDAKALEHQVVRVSAMRLAHVGSEAEASLYSMSVGQVSLAVKATDATWVPVTPMVRVGGTVRAMESLVADCRKLALEIRHLFAESE